MFKRKTALTIMFLCAFLFVSTAQEEALKKIDISDLKKHLTFLASDDLQGRKIGTEVNGLEITANYLADHAKSIGMKPAAPDYFQPVPMSQSFPSKDNLVELKNAKGKSIFQSNSVLLMRGVYASAKIEDSEIYLAGFGDDIENENIDGKVVVVASGTISNAKEGNFSFNYRREMAKLERIENQNPRAIILVSSPEDKENKSFNSLKRYFGRERYSVEKEKEPEGIPVIFTTPDFGDELCGGKGKYRKYLNKIVKENTSVPKKAKGKKLNLELKIDRTSISEKNVIGLIEGSDPQLRNEYVVFMAHYDHLGIGEDGDVYNGADDNGSGTVALMEVAEAFASLRTKPKRSIVFLWVTCEELGHIGSSYYADHPIFPMNKTVTSVNLDMVGRVYEGPRDDVWKDSPKKVKDFDGLYTLSNDYWPELEKINAGICEQLGLIPDTSLPKERFLRSSDHYHFHKKGVPILNYATGYHADYHKVGDEVERINFDKIKRVADLCFLLGLEIANLDEIEIKQ